MPLTEIEQYATRSMLAEGLKVDKIKEKLGKKPRSRLVETYVDTLRNSVGNLESSATLKEKHKLSTNKLSLILTIDPQIASNLVKKAIDELAKSENQESIRDLEIDDIVNRATFLARGSDLVANKTQSGAGGVASMTAGLATKADETKRVSAVGTSSRISENIYSVK